MATRSRLIGHEAAAAPGGVVKETAGPHSLSAGLADQRAVGSLIARSPTQTVEPDEQLTVARATLHVTALLATLLVAAVLVGTAVAMARGIEDEYIDALAPRYIELRAAGRHPEANEYRQIRDRGSALQAAAFRQTDLLVMYGSSELTYPNPYHVNVLLKEYPTGFTVLPVGYDVTTPLTILQMAATVGTDIRGKKVVISVSPTAFTAPMVSPAAYAGNFSRLQANGLAFSTELSLQLKQAVARRMLDYPGTLEDDWLLRTGLTCLADDAVLARACYVAVLPLGVAQTALLRLQDHWTVLDYIRTRPDLNPVVPRRPTVVGTLPTLDWSTLAATAERAYQQRTTNNPFGIADDFWRERHTDLAPLAGASSDEEFLGQLQRSKAWIDLDLLLRVLSELGARPVVITQPMQGPFSDYQGVSSSARSAYYAKLREVASAHGVTVVDFEAYDADPYFSVDHYSHLSEKGWVLYAQALDAVYRSVAR